MKYKIGIFGSAVDDNKKALAVAKDLGKELSKYKNIILITGASTGLPYMIASTAQKLGSKVWGFTPETSLKMHKDAFPDNDSSIFTRLFYVPKYYKKLFFINENLIFKSDKLARQNYRNVISTVNCDAAIIISGRWGTLNEFVNLYDTGKVIGILTGTGGIADELESLVKKIPKKTNAIVYFDNSPKKLISKILKSLNE